MAKPKKNKKKKSSLLRFLLKFCFVGGLIASVFIAFAYYRIDKQVLKTISTRSKSPLSAVFSAPVQISPLDKITKQTLAHYLSARNYREATSTPKLPGEYLISESQASIFVRSFAWANNKVNPENLIHVDFAGNFISDISNSSKQQTTLTLEPAIIASLSDRDFRASSYKKLSEIPAHVKQAVMAVEDERFYKHFGIDPEAVLRAMWANLRSMEFMQGGSTLTQQLAKNILFTPEKTFGRKLMEVLASFSIERRLDKDQILEMYLNEIYLGQEGSFAIHGVSEACQAFFGKPLEEISIAESAMLAGIIKAPSYFSPRKHAERALKRKDLALEKMLELGYINDKQLQTAKAQKIEIIQEVRNKRSAPFFTTALEQELSQHFNIEAANQTGINIYTGINTEMQNCADQILGAEIEAIEKKYPKLKRKDSPIEGALVAIEPQSGLVKAWAGGRDYSTNQFNHVSQAVRQIGSTIKPFLYLTALDSSLNNYKTATTTSILSDEPVQISQVNQKTWTPENYDRTFHGDVTLRYALENSLNLPAVYVAQRVGIENFAKTVQKFGITDNVQSVPALALGAADTTLLRLTGGYAALANGGIFVQPRLFITTEENEGAVLAKSDIQERKIADENAVYVLTDILKGVIQRGTAGSIRAMGYKAPAAGKTGTSNDTRDAWFVGFTPNLSVGVWIGYDDNKKIGLTGGALAAPIWTKFMQCILPYNPAIDFIPPENVVTADIDGESLERAGPGCPSASIVKELYVRGTEPNKICSRHNELRNDTGENEQLFDEENNPDSDTEEYRPRRRSKSFWDKIFN